MVEERRKGRNEDPSPVSVHGHSIITCVQNAGGPGGSDSDTFDYESGACLLQWIRLNIPNRLAVLATAGPMGVVDLKIGDALGCACDFLICPRAEFV